MYVAITRARKAFWFVDASEKAEPMHVSNISNMPSDVLTKQHQLYLTAKQVIETVRKGRQESLHHLAVSSSSKDWATLANDLMDRGQFSQAEKCFQRASLNTEAAVAHAFLLRELAEEMDVVRNANRSKAFANAAEALINAAENITSSNSRKTDCYNYAGRCYVKAGSHSEAAQAYFNASEFTMSAQQYHKAEMFDDALKIITTSS